MKITTPKGNNFLILFLYSFHPHSQFRIPHQTLTTMEDQTAGIISEPGAVEEPLAPNRKLNLTSLMNHRQGDVSWVNENTAILVIHGIGNQFPLETLDLFGRGLIKQYKKVFGDSFTISHRVVPKPATGNEIWFDNVVRLTKDGEPFHIDIYEYYWANHTEGQASYSDINNWLNGVVKGAKTFYQKNAKLGMRYKDSSFFFSKKTGAFRPLRYRLFISVASKFIMFLDFVSVALLKIVSFIPFVGEYAASILQSFSKQSIHKFTNVIGDLAIYAVVDSKSKFYNIRKMILNGAVESIKFLIEKEEDPGTSDEKETRLAYPSVLIAGHSLGSQVAYDAINRLNLLLNQNLIKHYDNQGRSTQAENPNERISDQLKGFITFGSPLDKTVFFLRENVPDENYLRQQLLEAYHGFKQRNWSLSESAGNPCYKLQSCLNRVLEDVLWRNYYDNADYVSGGLDYYEKLTNIDCDFKAKGWLKFTHSDYWVCDSFYLDLIDNFLSADSYLNVTRSQRAQTKKEDVGA